MKTRSISQQVAGEEHSNAGNGGATAQMKQAGAASMPDRRVASIAQAQHQELAQNSAQAVQLKARASIMDGRARAKPVQRVDNAPPQGECARPEPVKSGSQAPLQRKVSVKGGKEYGTAPQQNVSVKLKSIFESKATYLVKSQSDFDAIAAGQDAPMLAPRKHLIGERHDQTQFPAAVEDWGWGAGLLIEPYGQHERLVDSAQQNKKANPDSVGGERAMWVQAQALENTAAKALTNLVNGKIFGNVLLTGLKSSPPNFALEAKRTEFIKTCEACWKKIYPALTAAIDLSKYVADAAKDVGSGFIYYFFGGDFKEYDLVKQTLTVPLIQALGTGVDNIHAQIENNKSLVLNPEELSGMLDSIDKLIPVLQRLVVAYDPGGFSLDQIQTQSTQAVADRDIRALSPLRERYMLQQINGAKVPTLVKIGSAHVQNLEGKVMSDTWRFGDYETFRAKNMASAVD